MSRSIRFVAASMLFVLALAACSSDGTTPTTPDGDGVTPTTADGGAAGSDTTVAPATTAAPDAGSGSSETTAPVVEDEETPWWVLIVVGLAIILLVAVLAAGGKKKKQTVAVAAAPTTWKNQARAGYADAHWLYDNMTEDLAIWRGNTAYDASTGAPESVASGKADAWNQLTGRMNQGTGALYSAKASVQDPQIATMLQAVVNDLNSVRSDLDNRADTRKQGRIAEADPGADAPAAQGRARGAEQQASQILATDRNSLAASLTALARVI
jgi:hypothetical protein